MTCTRQPEVLDYLKGEIEPGYEAKVKEHLASCMECVRAMKQLDVLLGSLRQWEGVEPSPDFARRVEQVLLRQHPEWVPKLGADREIRLTTFDRLKRWLREVTAVPAWSISAAIHVALFAVLTMIFISVPSAPPNVTSVTLAPRGTQERDLQLNGEQINLLNRPAAKDIPDSATEEMDLPEFKGDPNRQEKIDLPGHGASETVEITPPKRLDLEILTRKIREDIILAFVDLRHDRQKEEARKQYGAEDTAGALAKALAWLAKHQNGDGSWPVDRLYGKGEYAVGLESLAMLAFLGDGHTHKQGAYRDNVARTVEGLLKQQKTNGLIGSETGNYMYNHGIATLALVEDYLMTRDERLEIPVTSAIGFILYAQNPTGGWGYQARSGVDDTSVTSWQISALRLARSMGRKEVIPALLKIQDWLARCTDTDGRVGYQKKGQYPNGYYTLTAIGLVARQWGVLDEDAALTAKQAEILHERPPLVAARGQQLENDLYYAYFGSLGMFQIGGEAWGQWFGPLKTKLLQAQQEEGNWAADLDRWSSYGGQLYTTAMGALILETPFRYPRLNAK